jgi:hypothetical protein
VLAVLRLIKLRGSPWPPKKYTEMFSLKAETFLENTSDIETQQKVKRPRIMKRLSIIDASCQQILGLESEILWEAGSAPTLALLAQLSSTGPRLAAPSPPSS